MTLITQRTLSRERMQREQEIQQMKELSEAKNRLDRELCQNYSWDDETVQDGEKRIKRRFSR